MQRFVFLTVDGLAHGAIYAAFALALVLIWRGTRIVNFAQGAMAVVSAYIAYSVASASGSYWLGALAAIASGLVLGVIVERGVMRFVAHTAPLSAIVVALGVSLLIAAVVGILYGVDQRPFPVPFSRTPYTIGSYAVFSPFTLFTFGVVAVVVIGIALLFTRTSVGLRMRASAFAPETARLLGVNVSRVLTFGWALAAGVGAVASLLIIPTAFLQPNAMDLVFVTAFTAAVIGGLDSPVGAVVGGLVVGLLLSYVSGYLGSNVTSIGVLVLLVVVLLLRPGGLFTMRQARRV
ncbi:MAG TPA: branched-chain amino acid ABC transporter permease [Micromonosporaceae bacterium]